MDMPCLMAGRGSRALTPIIQAMATSIGRASGGKSTGRPVIHGRHTKAAIAERRRNRALIRALLALVRECGD